MNKLAVMASVPFFIMLGMGPFPFKILGVPVDYLATGLLLSSIFIGASRVDKKHINVIGIILISYVISLYPSVLISSDFDKSLGRYIITMIYALMFLLLLKVNFSNYLYRLHQFVAILIFSFISLACIYIYYFSNYSGLTRFALVNDYSNFDAESYRGESSGVDPNMTAMGLILLLAFSYSGINSIKNTKLKILVVFFCLANLLLVLSIFASRTAFISALISFIPIFFSVLSIKEKKFMLGLAFILVVPMAVIFGGLFDNIVNRFDGGVAAEFDSTDGRISLISDGYHIFTSSFLDFIFGNGYFLSNPHNEYLRNFFDSGVIVGILHLILLIYFFYACRKRAKINMGHSGYVDAMFFPFLFMLGTYGHTKTFWVGLAFTWIVSGIKRQSIRI
jgi:hypothetical protein